MKVVVVSGVDSISAALAMSAKVHGDEGAPKRTREWTLSNVNGWDGCRRYNGLGQRSDQRSLQREKSTRPSPDAAAFILLQPADCLFPHDHISSTEHRCCGCVLLSVRRINTHVLRRKHSNSVLYRCRISIVNRHRDPELMCLFGTKSPTITKEHALATFRTALLFLRKKGINLFPKDERRSISIRDD